MVYISDHSLVKHYISVMHDRDTDTQTFRRMAGQVGILLAAEALRDMPLYNVDVTTPVAEAKVPMLSGEPPVIVPVLRAGLGMTDGILQILPFAAVGHIGMYRNEETRGPQVYLTRLPDRIDGRLIIVPDPMLATGGSAVAAIDHIKSQGGKDIRFICIIAAPEGLDALTKAHPDVDIYIGCLDEKLNEDAYIVPGLGDAGDRIFGTM